MKYLLVFSLICALSTNINAQKPVLNSPPTERVLVADETEIIASGKSGFRIICSNDSISAKLIRIFQNNGITKLTRTLKKDRRGSYWERSFYFKNESWNNVCVFINNLKPQ
jgi:hypothetical protein